MGPKEKQSNFFLSNLVINKKSGNNIYNIKPVFSQDGKSIFICQGKVCHEYNTHTGNYVKELFHANSDIISLQLHPLDKSQIVCVTVNGEVAVYNVKTNETECSDRLQLNPERLNAKKISKFTSENEEESEFDWTTQPLDSVDHRKFLHAEIKPYHGDPGKLLVWASWHATDEVAAHTSVFPFPGGEQKTSFSLRKSRLTKCPGNFALSKCPGSEVFVGLADKCIHVVYFDNPNSYYYTARKHYAGFKTSLTCLAYHPSENCLATGDSIGRIVIWKNIFDKYPLKETFHWHTRLVRDIAFSHYGNYVFSGGEECVLVKWSVTARKKQFLPRLSSAILYISEAPESSLLSVLTGDSKILVLDFNFQSMATIQSFSAWRGCRRSSRLGVFVVDPRTESIVMNGKAGHVQFLRPRGSHVELAYTMDITNRNFVNPIGKSSLANTEVTHAVFKSTGDWLVTAESRQENVCKQCRLKFWKHDEKRGCFVLKTNVEFPHEGDEVYSLEMSRDGTAATTGPDKKFRLWTLGEYRVGSVIKETWSVYSDRKYRRLSCYALDFSKDSSLLAVTFDRILTIWETDSGTLKCSLSHPDTRDTLKVCKFGSNESTHLVVAGTESSICCWNTITLSMAWSVSLALSVLVSDPFSIYMAAFSTDGSLVVFSPASPTPDLVIRNACPSKVVAAHCTLRGSSPKFNLYFVTEDQSLYCLEDANKSEVAAKVNEAAAATPFSVQVAQVQADDRAPADSCGKKSVAVSRNNQRLVAAVLDSPAHSLPNPSLLCSQLLKNLLLMSAEQQPAWRREVGKPEESGRSRPATAAPSKTCAEANESNLLNIVKTIFA